MALAYHSGGTSFAAASWSDATGFADDATLIVESGQQTISAGLDNSGLTNGISYLHVRSGFTGEIGSASSPLLTKFRSTYTTKPNLILEGGTMYLTMSNTCNQILVLGGRLILVSGTVTLLEVRSGYLVRGGTVTATTADVQGGDFQDGAENSTTIGTLHVGTATAIVRGVVTTANTYEGGNLTLDHASGITTGNLYGGRMNLLRGGATTINGRRGLLDVRKATRDQTIGTLNQWPRFLYESTGSASTNTVTTSVLKVGGPAPATDTGP